LLPFCFLILAFHSHLALHLWYLCSSSSQTHNHSHLALRLRCLCSPSSQILSPTIILTIPWSYGLAKLCLMSFQLHSNLHASCAHDNCRCTSQDSKAVLELEPPDIRTFTHSFFTFSIQVNVYISGMYVCAYAIVYVLVCVINMCICVCNSVCICVCNSVCICGCNSVWN